VYPTLLGVAGSQPARSPPKGLRTRCRRRRVRRKLSHTRKISNLRLSPEELAARRPGIVYASARCYSYERRWDNRAGFDMEALCVTGYTTEEGSPERPAFLPTLVMNDYIAGYLGAAGIQAALIRRAKSWR
jgi:crotonobetainyl-CoA:carnitine CoA-transferase CaiB-like acyl-CoA transferase